MFPQLAEVKIEFAWGGEVDITLNRGPHFGRLAPNVYFLQGFSGHGIVLTGIAVFVGLRRAYSDFAQRDAAHLSHEDLVLRGRSPRRRR